MTPESPKPTMHCKGLWLPIELVERLQEKKVCPLAVLLAGFINAYSSKGDPCFATNQHFASLLGVSEHRISNMITDLESVGIVKTVGWKVTSTGRLRLLETTWQPTGGSRRKSQDPPRRLSQDRLDGKVKTPPSLHIETEINTRCVSNGDAVSIEAKQLSHLFFQVITKHQKLTTYRRLKAWPSFFVELLKVRKASLVRKAITWFDSNIEGGFTPKLYCARSFCENFPRIEDAMRRSGDLESVETQQVW